MYNCIFFFLNDPATTEIYTLSLHDALPISYAEADQRADEQVELPQADQLAGEKESRAEADHARRVHPARTEPIEEQADQRRGEAVHQQVDRVDAGQLRATPPELALQRQQEDDVGIAQAAPEHVEREARH